MKKVFSEKYTTIDNTTKSKNLSANGSSTLPIFVTLFKLLATAPSNASVAQ
jgi:hypothetical protein